METTIHTPQHSSSTYFGFYIIIKWVVHAVIYQLKRLVRHKSELIDVEIAPKINKSIIRCCPQFKKLKNNQHLYCLGYIA